jgi:hypothetical protein
LQSRLGVTKSIFIFSFSLKKKKQKFKAIRRLPFARQIASQNGSPHRIAKAAALLPTYAVVKITETKLSVRSYSISFE